MKKWLIALNISLIFLLSGCADNLTHNQEQDINQGNEQIFDYAVIGQLEIDENTHIIADVFYDGTVELDGTEFYNNTPYISVKETETGRIRSVSRIPTGLVSERGSLSPKSVDIKAFEIGEGISKTVIAVAVPLLEEEYELVFYQFYDDLYGIYPLTREFGMPMDTKTADFDTLELVGDNEFVCGDFRFEFSLEPYPGSIKMNAM
ncbi:MAG: hypothetical protein K2O14_09505 [Oscillospiraceae bacterium]|nr:hypothetical protein [Oscillospiraceae bacterium]